MKNKKYLFSISLLISLLIILIPIAVATELETYDNLVLKTKEEKINLYQNLGDDPYVTDRDQLNDPGQACVEQHKETSSFADSLDNSVISTLEKIASILFAITTTMSAIDIVISTISIAIGMLSGPCCPPDPTAPPRCAASEVKFRAWSTVYAKIQPLACFVNCGWCTGGDCFSIPGVDLSKISLGAIPNIGIAGPGSGIAQFGLSPYDNIYTAIGCLCPIAIIFNLRKLKTIYDVYDCCIQQACTNGLSTEACEAQLDEATCMYWEGSLYSIIAKILISILTGFIAGKLIEVIGLSRLLACVYAVLKIVQVPIVIKNVMSAWEYMGRSFKGIDCEDLGFDDIKEEILEDWQYVTLVDKDDDGVYDYNVPEWTKIDDKTSTTTLRLPDGKGGYELKTFTKTKEEGKLLATIKDENGKEVSTLKWEELKGKNVPARVNIYSDGSASVGYKAVDNFKVENNQIKFLDKDKKSIETFTNPKELGDVKIPGTDLRWSEFEKIDGDSLVSGKKGEDGYKKIIFGNYNEGLGRRMLVVTETKEGKETIKQINWYNDDSAIVTEGDKKTYVPAKGNKIEIKGTLLNALKDPDPATSESARNAISMAIKAGVNEQDISNAIYFPNGDLEIVKDWKTGITITQDGQKLVKDKFIEGSEFAIRTTTTDIATNEKTKVSFNWDVQGKKVLELPYEFGKNIDPRKINFIDSKVDEKVIVDLGNNRYDVYNIEKIGNTKIITKTVDGNLKYYDTKREPVFEGGQIKQHIISSQDGAVNIPVSPEVLKVLTDQSGKEMKDMGNELGALQNAYQKFEDKSKITSDHLELEGERVIVRYGKIEEKIDAQGTYEKWENNKLTKYERILPGEEVMKAKGKYIQVMGDGTLNLAKSEIDTIKVLNKDGTLGSTTNKLKDGRLVTTKFDKEGNLDLSSKIIVYTEGIKPVELTPDKEGNFKVNEFLRYNTKGELEYMTDRGWATSDKASIVERFRAFYGSLTPEYKSKLDKLDNLNGEQRVTAERDLENDKNLQNILNQKENNEEAWLGSVAEQVQKDKKTAEETAEKIEEKKPSKDKKTIAREEIKQKVAYQMMYEILWTILDYTLGEKVNDMVEDKCKEDYEASYPSQDTPSESGGPATCEDTNNNVYNAQFISKTELNNECKYEVSYALTACNHPIDYTIQLSGPGWRQNIEEGTLELGQTISRNKITTGICAFERICITIKGEDTVNCFPPKQKED